MQTASDLVFPGEITLLDVNMTENEVLEHTDHLDGTGVQVTTRGV